MPSITRRQFLAGSGLLLLNGVPAGAQTPMATPVSGERPWWSGALFYELFVRSFFDSNGDGLGDMRGVIEKLDYLRGGESSISVDALWLMPIMASPSYHGYDVTDYEQVNPDYGTNDEFRELVATLHDRGMRIIIDFPINHTSVEHPWFVDAASNDASPYRGWYIFSEENPGYPGPWGQHVWHQNPHGSGYYYGIFDASMPDLDYTNQAVNTEIERITTFWLNEMGVDGFRMDAIKHMIERDTVQEGTPETVAWIRQFSDFVRSVKPDAFTVGEVMSAGTDSLLPYYPDTLDTYFHFQIARETVNGANFGNARKIATMVASAQERLPEHRWASFLTNHDEQRIASDLKGDADKLKVAAMCLLSLPGTPFMYYGEEIGMPGTKPDPNIRTPMQWSDEPHGGFSTVAPYTSLQDGWETLNVAAQDADPESLLNTYRLWGGLRSSLESLRTGEFVPLETDNRSLFAFLRRGAGETSLVVINMGGDTSEGFELVPDSTFTRAEGATPHAPQLTFRNGAIQLPPIPGRSGAIWVVA